jgi:hypothetical protein
VQAPCNRQKELLTSDSWRVNVRGEEGGRGDWGLEAPVLWLLRQVASSFCVCSICMPVRSIILVVETLSATVRRHGLALRRWNSRTDPLVPQKGVLTSVLKLNFLTHRWLIYRLNITKTFHSKQVERSNIRYSSLLLVGLYLSTPLLLQYLQCNFS